VVRMQERCNHQGHTGIMASHLTNNTTLSLYSVNKKYFLIYVFILLCYFRAPERSSVSVQVICFTVAATHLYILIRHTAGTEQQLRSTVFVKIVTLLFC